MNIFKYEFRSKIKSILVWGLSIGAFLIFYMAFFPGLAKDSQAFESLMSSLPKEMLDALGLREGLSMTSLIGYFTLTFTMVQVAIAIQSANYGFSILSVEERELTADFLMTKPVSRTKIFLSKFLAALLSLVITSLIISLASIISIELFSGGEAYSFANLIKFLVSVPVFQIIFLSLGMLISLFFKKIRSVISFSMGLAIFLYIINTVRDIGNSKILKYLTPYYYFEPGVILKSGEYDLKLMAISVAIIAVSLVGGFFIYNKKDISSI